MIVPQPFQYQGSKRALAPLILRYLPQQMSRLVEPFCGSAAVSIAAAARGRVKEFWLNDFNKPLAELLALMINNPNELAKFYGNLWRADHADALEHYYQVREEFNRKQDARMLLYLLARCVKGAVRYNGEGLFNQSPDKRRLGTRPETMKQNIAAISALLRGRTIVTSQSYEDVLANVRGDDVVYMDPPYQGVCGERDSRYFAGIAYDDFVSELESLNHKCIRYVVSYDGRLGNRSYGKPLPDKLKLTLVEVEAGRSSQATLLGRNEVTVESLYLSPALADELEAQATFHRRNQNEQMVLMEPRPTYGKKAKVSKRVS
ncbi:MAG TPA: DNA adenine methylase [Verrucomicrobiae bacterium]|nr:DNA adenine methylase [Verrucomicrobiae bacterium]